MTAKRKIRLFIVTGTLLCAGGLGITSCALIRQGSPGAHNGDLSGADSGQGWRKIEVSADGQTGVFEICVFRSPIPFEPLPLDQTKRDTPLNTWISLKSHGIAGKNVADLEKYASHFLDPDYLLNFVRDEVKLSPEDYFTRLRKTEKNSRAIATVKYKDYTLLIYKFDGSGNFAGHTYTVAACMVKKGNDYYIDEQPKKTDPVLKEIVDNDYKQFGF